MYIFDIILCNKGKTLLLVSVCLIPFDVTERVNPPVVSISYLMTPSLYLEDFVYITVDKILNIFIL